MAVKEQETEQKMAPRKFGDYTLLEHLGTGGIGSVYRGRHEKSGRIAAVKIFSPDDDHPPDQMRVLKDREVRMLVSVQHPNVVSFYDDGHVDEQFYYAMEYVGDSLLEEMRSDRTMSTLEKIRILRQTANALQAIHNQGIVHRDVKPGNILLDYDPSEAVHAKVTDLGIARHVSEADIVRETTSKKIPGTPKYLSPEQIEQRALDGRSDVFGLGILAYQLLTGDPPFSADDTEGYLSANRYQNPEPIDVENSGFPRFINQLVLKMLAKNREERYDSHTLARDLELAEQHLVSGAELVEETNRQSIFYVPSEDEEETDEVSTLDRILPVSRVLAGAAVLLGLCVSVYAWHALRPPSLPAAGNPGDASAAPAQLLETASNSLENEHWWHALACLQQLESRKLETEQRLQFDRLREKLQAALVPEMAAKVRRMADEERIAEAEACLARLKGLFPASEQIAGLKTRIEEARTTAERGLKWYEQWNAVADLIERGKYRDALSKLRPLANSAEEDSERLSLANQSISDVLNRWASDLKDGYATPEQMREFLDVLRDFEGKNLPDLDVTAQALSIRFKIAEFYEDRERYEDALNAYSGILKDFPGQATELAREGRTRARRMLVQEPMKTADFSRLLEEEGFATTVWYTRMNSAVTRGDDGQTLSLTVPPSSSPPASSMTSRRPLANTGFTLSVDFKIDQAPDDSSDWKAGMEVVDRRGRRMRAYFNGAQYTALRSYVLRGRLVSGGVPLGGAFGDESETWHTLSLEYRFGSDSVAVMLDDKELRDLALELEDCKVRLFLENQSKSACSVTFRNPRCKP